MIMTCAAAAEELLLHGDPLTLQLRLELHREVVLDVVVVPVVLPHVHVAWVLVPARPVCNSRIRMLLPSFITMAYNYSA